MTIMEALAKWDAGEPLESISMGGLGDAYEQCIQICIFEVIRDWLAVERPDLHAIMPPRDGGYPEMNFRQKDAWDIFLFVAEAAVARANKELDLGLSGAQAGASKNAAFNFIASPSWDGALERVPKDRLILVRKSASHKFDSAADAYAQGLKAGRDMRKASKLGATCERQASEPVATLQALAGEMDRKGRGMKIIEGLEQGSAAWHSFRQAHLGGSDASLIAAWFMGQPWPYGTWAGADLYALFLEKTGRGKPKKPTAAMKHGTDSEAGGRAWYENETANVCCPVVMEHERIPYLSASLDGWTGAAVVEIKSPTEPQDHRLAREGQIPDKYYAQLQHSMFVAGCAHLDFVSWYKNEGVIVPVAADEGFQAKLRLAEDEFWSWVLAREFPLPTGEAERNDGDWQGTIDALWALQAQRRDLEAKERELKLWLARRMPAGKVRGGGATVSLRVRREFTRPASIVSEGLTLEIRRA